MRIQVVRNKQTKKKSGSETLLARGAVFVRIFSPFVPSFFSLSRLATPFTRMERERGGGLLLSFSQRGGKRYTLPRAPAEREVVLM
jgi:hypothetical protein